MDNKCAKCKSDLLHWSKFRDLKQKEGIGLAVCGSILNGFEHFFLGESNSRKHKPDFRTLDLFYCPKCRAYYLKCPGCDNLNLLADMPNETHTRITCSGCGKRILYAEGDYSMGG